MKVSTNKINATVAEALAEDIGSGDISAALVPANSISEAMIISREPAVVCGCKWAEAAFLQLDSNIKINWLVEDGNTVSTEQKLCTISGNTRAILTAERTALNFLQTLSATATTTQKYVEKLKPYATKLLDTRKTIPLLRAAQKYAVSCGGGHNHRFGLYDAYLIKENHIKATGSIENAVDAAKTSNNKIVEVEVENLNELQQAIDAGADIIMLDNFNINDLKTAVSINNGAAKLEASGNVTLNNLAEIAATGVDYISTGAITKNIHAIDLSLLIIK